MRKAILPCLVEILRDILEREGLMVLQQKGSAARLRGGVARLNLARQEIRETTDILCGLLTPAVVNGKDHQLVYAGVFICWQVWVSHGQPELVAHRSSDMNQPALFRTTQGQSPDTPDKDVMLVHSHLDHLVKAFHDQFTGLAPTIDYWVSLAATPEQSE